jgi:hypothetical protein
MTFFPILKKFLSPMKEHPWDYFWNIIEAIILSAYLISSIEITKRIIIAIQWNQQKDFYWLLVILWAISILTTW